jgi:hypothetical protein
MIDPINGLALVASVRQAAEAVRPPKIFWSLIVGRLAAMCGCSRRELELVLPMELARDGEQMEGAYDLPATHYTRRGELLDQLAAVLLFDPRLLRRSEVVGINADQVRDHVLHGILLAGRVSGEPMDAHVPLDELRRLVTLHEDGYCFEWYAGLYAAELQKLLRIEAAFKAALM